MVPSTGYQLSSAEGTTKLCQLKIVPNTVLKTNVKNVLIIEFSTGTHRNVSFITTPTPGNLSGSEMLLISIFIGNFLENILLSNANFLENISVLSAIAQRKFRNSTETLQLQDSSA